MAPALCASTAPFSLPASDWIQPIPPRGIQALDSGRGGLVNTYLKVQPEKTENRVMQEEVP